MAIKTRAQVAAYAAQAGFSGDALDIAVAIAQAESGFDTNATHLNYNGTTDYGLWQINTVNGYNPAQLTSDPSYNAKAAYAIYRSWNNTFNAWTTFGSGAYKKYLSNTTTTQPTQQVKSATKNDYPKGQCTWWASQRYHDLTGYYVPWTGNAKDWVAGAQQYGWQVSDSPRVPSIMVLQPSVNGADPTFGHVAVVEKINHDGTVYTSAQNMSGVPLVNGVAYLSYRTGPGVSFVYAGSGTTTPGAGGSNTVTTTSDSITFTPLLTQIHNTLVETPGFYGIALAVDEAEQFSGWVDLTNHDTAGGGFFGWLNPTSAFDIVGFTRSVGATLTDNFIPFCIRANLVAIGMSLIFLLLIRIVFSVAETGLDVAKDIIPFIPA